LIPLTRDTSSEVRSWATFGIGTMIDLDLPEIRQALTDRLDDTDRETRSEAVVGLANRGDPRAFEPTVDLLRADVVGRMAIVAAAALADVRLLDDLRGLESWWDVDPEALQDAIDACVGAGLDGRPR
jgi:HEAT repeat protein